MDKLIVLVCLLLGVLFCIIFVCAYLGIVVFTFIQQNWVPILLLVYIFYKLAKSVKEDRK